MVEQRFENKAPVAWSPAGLISWYRADGEPVTLVTAWVALVGGDNPRIRMAWHGHNDPQSRLWTGGDFVLNVPHEADLTKISEMTSRGSLCINAQEVLGYTCTPGDTADAPRLLNSAIQIECLAGKLVESDFDTELCGTVVCVHRDGLVVDAGGLTDLCALQPLTPFCSP